MVSRFVSAGEFFLEGVFLSSISFFQITSFFFFLFVSFVWMQCTKCQECRKTYYCVVVQGMKWCFCFVSCHKWSVLDVQFRVKMIESCSSRASTSGVDIFWGWGGILYLFCNLFHSCENLCGSQHERVRAEDSFPALVLLVYAGQSFPLKQDINLLNPTLRLWISVVLWWSVGAELFVCEETEDGHPPFREGVVFSILCPRPPLTTCSSYYLSCLYMWKTEQQTAASISFRPASAELDFPLFPQRLCTLFTE